MQLLLNVILYRSRLNRQLWIKKWKMTLKLWLNIGFEGHLSTLARYIVFCKLNSEANIRTYHCNMPLIFRISDFHSHSCFLGQESLPSLPSTGWFLELIWAWFHNQTKMIWGSYCRATFLSNKLSMVYRGLKTFHNWDVKLLLQSKNFSM